jgi:hypothetical protein
MENKKQILFLVLILIFIILIIFLMVFLIKHKNIIKSNPIEYGIKYYNFSHCYCYKGDSVIKYPINIPDDITWGK